MSDRGAPGRISRGYAWVVLAIHPAVPVAWIALVVLTTLTLPSLGSAGSAPLEDLVAKDSPALAAQARSAALFGGPLATDTVVVQRNPRGLTAPERDAFAAGARAVAEQRAGRDLAGLRAVVPVLDVPVGPVRWRERGTTAVGYAAFDPQLNLEDRRALAERYVRRFLRPAPGVRAGITGAAPGRLAQYDAIAGALPLITVGSVLLIGLIVGLHFRSVAAPLVTLAVAVAVPQAAAAVTVAGITLAASFALLVLVPLRSFQEFALLMVIGVLIDTLLVRSLLVPGLVSLFGEASWWPGRRIDPPRHDELIAAVARRAGIDAAQANRAAQATLATLSERISRSESRTLAAQLPAAFRPAVGRRAERFGLDTFTARVAERSNTDAASALEHARAVVATLDEYVDETTMSYVRSRLGEDYEPLFSSRVELRH